MAESRKKLLLERLLTFHKAASNITHSAIASQERSACVLHTVQHALTAYSLVRQPVQCSMLCMLLCDPASFAYYCTTSTCSSTANASRALVPHYINVVILLVVRKRCQTSCTTCRSTTGIPWDCTVMYHCHTVHSPLRWWISTHYTINFSVPVRGAFLFNIP